MPTSLDFRAVRSASYAKRAVTIQLSCFVATLLGATACFRGTLVVAAGRILLKRWGSGTNKVAGVDAVFDENGVADDGG